MVSLEVELVEVRLPADKGREVQKEKEKRLLTFSLKLSLKNITVLVGQL